MTNQNGNHGGNENGSSQQRNASEGDQQPRSGRGSNLTNADRSRGGQRSAQVQQRNARGRFAGRTAGTSGQGGGGGASRQDGAQGSGSQRSENASNQR